MYFKTRINMSEGVIAQLTSFCKKRSKYSIFIELYIIMVGQYHTLIGLFIIMIGECLIKIGNPCVGDCFDTCIMVSELIWLFSYN